MPDDAKIGKRHLNCMVLLAKKVKRHLNCMVLRLLWLPLINLWMKEMLLGYNRDQTV
jgi:hypothetical protein